jgi:sec-independent protein translocase protein TatA
MGLFESPWHIAVVILIAVLFFGGRKLPELGKGLGEGLRGFKEGLKGVTDPDPTTKPGETAHTVTPKADETTKVV